MQNGRKKLTLAPQPRPDLHIRLPRAVYLWLKEEAVATGVRGASVQAGIVLTRAFNADQTRKVEGGRFTKNE